MKLRLYPVYPILLSAVLLNLSLGSGCSTSSGGSGGYQLRQTRNDIDAAMVRYHNRVSFGFLTANEQQRVSVAYKAYQSAFNEAVQQAQSNYTAPTPLNVRQLADQLLSVLDSIP